MDRLHGQATRLSRLVIDLLDVSQLERGTLTLHCAHTDMISLVSSIVEEFSARTPKRRFVFTGPEQSVEINIDPLRINQVISNFLDNAIKYTPEDSPIEVTLESLLNRIRVCVIDHGVGMPKEQQSELFKPFYRGRTDREERASGLGLGLFVCNEIIGLHGGTIGVVSKEGIGSTFYFEIPKKDTSP